MQVRMQIAEAYGGPLAITAQPVRRAKSKDRQAWQRRERTVRDRTRLYLRAITDRRERGGRCLL